MKIKVSREHANAGDVIVSLENVSDTALKLSFNVPGDVTPYTALTMLAPWLEEQVNERFEVAAALRASVASANEALPIPDGLVKDPDTGWVSRVVNFVEVERFPPDSPEAKQWEEQYGPKVDGDVS